MPGNAELIEELRAQLARIEARRADNDAMLARLTETDAELAALAVTATSPDQAVTVVAGPGGIVRSVRLAEHAMRSSAAALSEVIDATVRQAVAQAARRQVEIVRDRVGHDVDPLWLLGPQAAFAELRAPAPPVTTDDDDGPPTILARR
jgi:DNA-binding protein YbaB